MTDHRGYRPRMDDDGIDVRAMASQGREVDESVCVACRAGSHRNCRSKTCACPKERS